jgi:hypothetical protein
VTTSEVVLQGALDHADGRTPTDEAIEDLLTRSRGSRVSVVLAHQEANRRLTESPSTDSLVRVVELLDETLERGKWALD